MDAEILISRYQDSDADFDILEIIGYPVTPTSFTISDKTKILG